MLPELISLNAEELGKLKTLNDETIATLQNDIELYKWQLKQFGPSAELLQPSPSQRFADPTNGLPDNFQEEIATINSRLQQTSNFTGITIEKISREVLELDETHSKTHFELTLKVLGKVMYLKYEIDELQNQDEASRKGGRVTWMEIKIDRETNEAIGTALTKTIEEISIQPALCLIKSYLKFVKVRDSLIQYFVQEYPDSVAPSVQNGLHYLDISDHNPNHPIFGIEWKEKYETDCIIVPEVNLRVKASQKLKDMDSQGVLKAAPDMFITLKAEKGVKSAIDCIIQLVISANESFSGTPG